MFDFSSARLSQLRNLLRDLPLTLQLEALTVSRDRRALFYAFLVPALLYPLLMALLMFGYERISRYNEESTVRLELPTVPEELADLQAFLLEQPRIELVTPERADVALRVHPLTSVAFDVPARFRFSFTIESDTSQPRTTAASLRLLRVLDDYRADRLRALALERGASASDWDVYDLHNTNLAEGAAMGRFVQSAVLPVMFVVMVAIGSFYPAIDSIAGERERGSWETTMTLATSRVTIVLAKLLVSAGLGCAAGLINVFSMAVALEVFFDQLLGELGQLNVIEMSIPFASLPMLALVGGVLSITISACMMVLAAFARTFREGQAMVAPFYLVILPPALLLADPDLRLTTENAWLPVVSLGLALRSSLLADPPTILLSVALTCNAVLAVATLLFADFVLRHEDVLEGGSKGGLFRFLRRRARGNP